MQYEYDYDWMTLSSGQTLERLLLAQVLREGHFLGPRCTARDPGALPGTQVHCQGPRCTVQVHYLGQVHLPGP